MTLSPSKLSQAITILARFLVVLFSHPGKCRYSSIKGGHYYTEQLHLLVVYGYVLENCSVRIPARILDILTEFVRDFLSPSRLTGIVKQPHISCVNVRPWLI
jgi:hypothetical protein